MPSTNASENPSSACKVVWEIRSHLRWKIFRIISTISISLTGFVCALTLSMYSVKNSFLMFYVISICDTYILQEIFLVVQFLLYSIFIFLKYLQNSSFLMLPCSSGKEVSKVDLKKFRVKFWSSMYLGAAFILGKSGTSKKPWTFCIVAYIFYKTCVDPKQEQDHAPTFPHIWYFSSDVTHIYADVGKYTSVGIRMAFALSTMILLLLFHTLDVTNIWRSRQIYLSGIVFALSTCTVANCSKLS